MNGFFADYLAFDIDQPLQAADRLTFPYQRLRSITCGDVFHDAIRLQETRRRFSYYPRSVRSYLLAAGWARIGQEEHLMGRAGLAGDEKAAPI